MWAVKGDITDIDGSVVARQYNDRDQLAQIDYNSAMVATFAYDAGSRRTSRTLGDTPGTQTTWTYGRQDNLPTAINSGIPGASFSYTYDANKNKLTEGISAPMANYGFNSTTYDQADRLTAWNRTDGNLDQAWDLSLVGDWATFTENQVQELRTHTSVHEIAAIDANPIAHDPAGNLTRNAGDTLDRYTWDFDNRLLAADVDQDGTPDCLYRHDALGRRVSKTVPDGEGSATVVFVGTIQELEYSPHAMQVVAEYAGDAAPASPARKFVYAEYIDEPIMMLATNGATTTPYYYHQNSLYSVAAITDVSGTVVERYAYSAYREPLFLDVNANLLDPQASTIDNPYLFTGRRLDEETSLYYYRARMYDAELGRFVSKDPIGYAGLRGLYSYVENRPLFAVDPTGLKAIPETEKRDLQQAACKCKWIKTNFDSPEDLISNPQGSLPEGFVTCKDGKPHAVVVNKMLPNPKPDPHGFGECTLAHEQHHVDQISAVCADEADCEGKEKPCHIIAFSCLKTHPNVFECYANGVAISCLVEKAIKLKKQGDFNAYAEALLTIHDRELAMENQYGCGAINQNMLDKYVSNDDYDKVRKEIEVMFSEIDKLR